MHILWALFSHSGRHRVGLEMFDFALHLLKLDPVGPEPRHSNTVPFSQFSTARKPVKHIRYRPKDSKSVPDWNSGQSMATDRLLEVLKETGSEIEAFTIPVAPYKTDHAYLPQSFSVIRPQLDLYPRIDGEGSRRDSVIFLRGLATETSNNYADNAEQADGKFALPLLNLDIDGLPHRFVGSLRHPENPTYTLESRVRHSWCEALFVDDLTFRGILAAGCIGIVPLPIRDGLSMTSSYDNWDGEGSNAPLRRDLRPWITGKRRSKLQSEWGEKQWFWQETSVTAFTKWCRRKIDDGSWVGGGWT